MAASSWRGRAFTNSQNAVRRLRGPPLRAPYCPNDNRIEVYLGLTGLLVQLTAAWLQRSAAPHVRIGSGECANLA